MNTLHMIKKQSDTDIDSPQPVNLSVAHQTNKTDASMHSRVDRANTSVQPIADKADASVQLLWAADNAHALVQPQ